jgi:hypothetical protein
METESAKSSNQLNPRFRQNHVNQKNHGADKFKESTHTYTRQRF